MIYVKSENSADPVTSESSSGEQLTINEVKTELNESSYVRLASKSSWFIDLDSGSLNFMNSKSYTNKYQDINWPPSVITKRDDGYWRFAPGVLTGWIGTEDYSNNTNLYFIAKPQITQSVVYSEYKPMIPELYLACVNKSSMILGEYMMKVGDKICEPIADFNDPVKVNTRYMNQVASTETLANISNLPYFLQVDSNFLDTWYFLTDCDVNYPGSNIYLIAQTTTVLNSPNEYAYKKFIRILWVDENGVQVEVDWHEI